MLDLDAYLRRIGWTGAPRPAPTAETLSALHRAHALAIPFENLDIQLGRPIALDLGALQQKMIGARRGGYCFEQNTLFGAVLGALGFAVTALGARVWMGPARPAPRTHKLLRVVVAGGEPWLADVGFGADSLLEPIPFVADGRVHEQGAWAYRLRAEPGPVARLVLTSRQPGGAWIDDYAFTLEPWEAADDEVANHYTSTHPASRFVTTLTAQRVSEAARWTLRGKTLSEARADGVTTREIASPEQLLAVLAEVFGLRFPAGTRFRSPDFSSP